METKKAESSSILTVLGLLTLAFFVIWGIIALIRLFGIAISVKP